MRGDIDRLPLLDMRAVARAYQHIRDTNDRYGNGPAWWAARLEEDPHYICDHRRGVCKLDLLGCTL